MTGWAFLGGFLAVSAAIGLLCAGLYRKWQRFLQNTSGAARILSAVTELEREEPPRSLCGCDLFIIPQILEDFPDFDPETARTRARNDLEAHLHGKQDLQIHQIVYTRYLPASIQKTVVFQAAVGWRESGALTQKRFELFYTYLLPTGDAAVAANCPNCGGNLGFGDVECPYCGSRVVNAMGCTWRLTRVTEI